MKKVDGPESQRQVDLKAQRPTCAANPAPVISFAAAQAGKPSRLALAPRWTSMAASLSGW